MNASGDSAAAITVRPIAVLRTPFAEKFGVPRQSGIVEEAEARVEFFPEFARADFLRGLESFSHVWLITHFHQSPTWTGASTVRPPRLGGNERVGVFASRSPNRPNPLGLSLVRVLAVGEGSMRVSGIDAVDGTPVIDIKPYLPWCEALPDARADWAQSPPSARAVEFVSIPEDLAKALGADAALVRRLLQLDLQPAYQQNPDRTYGMTVAGWNVRWRHRDGGRVELVEARRV